MSGIDPKMLAWFAGSTSAQEAADARRRIAALERSQGLAVQSVRADVDAVSSEVDVLSAEVVGKEDGIVIGDYSPYLGGAGDYNYAWSFGESLRAGWAVAVMSGNAFNFLTFGSWQNGDTVYIYGRAYAAGTLVIQFFGLRA